MDKLKSTICFSCCFRGTDVDPFAHQPASAPTAATGSSSSMIRASSTWIRSRASELPERCGAMVSRIGKHGNQQQHHHQRRRHGSADFRYDPLSYALNFDDGPVFDEDAEPVSPSQYRYRSFASRLPQSPPMQPVRAVPTGEVACS